MTPADELLSLYNLARAYGVETEYQDVYGRRQEALPDALLAVLRALGAPIEKIDDIPTARRERRQLYWRQSLEPVIVAWDAAAAETELRLPLEKAVGPAACHLELETGETRDWAIDLADLPTNQDLAVERQRYVAKRLVVPEALPTGYHRFSVDVPGHPTEATIISAPAKAYSPLGEASGGVWGAFLPLYALYSKRSWGGGDFSDLRALLEWVSSLGGNVVATLPFLASFLDKPCDPSPYTPVSRMFWNEFYVDVTAVPEMARCPEALALVEGTEFTGELEALRSLRLVDYRRQMALKRRVLEKLAKSFTSESGERCDVFQRFLKECDGLEDYVRFRAVCESRGETWNAWPQRLRDGVLQGGDCSREVERYHAYVQWLADEQLHSLSDEVRQKGLRLYLDLPLGVHRDGYDTWRNRNVFVGSVSAGAPPDALFHKGQNWGFPPLHPQKVREEGYRYPIAYLNHHMKYADILRIDHVMGMHHLFWVPEGMEATEGVYVRYPADELYAVLSIESHRHKCLVVGENLGTVPSYINAALSRHSVYSMYVAQYELAQEANVALREVPADTVASLNTHDMPPFSAFWQGLDIEHRAAMGLETEAESKIRTEGRHAAKRALARLLKQSGYLEGDPGEPSNVLRACLSLLADSTARILLVNLEDLWLETEQHNMPGVVQGHPNWQRKARYDFESFSQMPEVLDLLSRVRRPSGTGKALRDH